MTGSCDCQKFYAVSWRQRHERYKMSGRKPKYTSNYWCVVPGCTSDSRKKDNTGKYPWMTDVTFLPFPTLKKNPKLRSKWIEMIRRPLGYIPLSHHRVCSRHFGTDSNVPELFPWNNYGQFQPQRSTASITKRELGISPPMDTDVMCESDPEKSSVCEHGEGL